MNNTKFKNVFIAINNFLNEDKLTELIRFVAENEANFESSSLIDYNAEDGYIDAAFRRSRVLYSIDDNAEAFADLVRTAIPDIVKQFGMDDFPIEEIEAQITASNDGDYFKLHSDNSHVPTRALSYVYFFHKEPKAFEGGELRIYYPNVEDNKINYEKYETITPHRNTIIFFPSILEHEVLPITCCSNSFRDSRFTFNGWIRGGSPNSF
jgi:Rps23 Pro-64 3,4-dihydroxylase Tpa1-like proline 4-hydroxylase